MLDLMKMDMLNFTIQNLRPYLQECYVQYEQEKFQKILDKLPSKSVGKRREELLLLQELLKHQEGT